MSRLTKRFEVTCAVLGAMAIVGAVTGLIFGAGYFMAWLDPHPVVIIAGVCACAIGGALWTDIRHGGRVP